MDEVQLLCGRLLADPLVAAEVATQARAGVPTDRLATLRAALIACRGHHEHADRAARADVDDGLAAAVAGELAQACGRLPVRDRELLALRELLGLSHDEIGVLLDLDQDAVAGALAQASVGLRTQLRGPGQPVPPCAERDRALRAIARRHDETPVSESENDWLIAHLASCRGCAQAHAAVLEGAACYGAWTADA